jgi:hypothetical protein
MLRRAAILLVVCVPAAVMAKEAGAKEARIGAVPISLPPPIGYCEMDAALASDAQMLAGVNAMLGATGNRLVVASAECKQLKDWRAGKRATIDNMAQYQTLASLEEGELTAPPEITIKQVCDQMRAQADQLMDDVAENLRDRAEKAMESVKFEDTKFLGVIAQAPLACYGGLLQKTKAQAGAEKTEVTVFATTVIKGKIVFSYLFAPFIDGDTIGTMLAKQKANVDRLHNANVDKPLNVKAPSPKPPMAKAPDAKPLTTGSTPAPAGSAPPPAGTTPPPKSK